MNVFELTAFLFKGIQCGKEVRVTRDEFIAKVKEVGLVVPEDYAYTGYAYRLSREGDEHHHVWVLAELRVGELQWDTRAFADDREDAAWRAAVLNEVEVKRFYGHNLV